MPELKRVAPVFPVTDVEAALRFYASLGFTAERYDGEAVYGYATRDGVELHLGQVSSDDTGRATAYLWTDDSDALAAEWQAAGAKVHLPQDTEWRQHEGALVDPDGNVIRFGTPMA